MKKAWRVKFTDWVSTFIIGEKKRTRRSQQKVEDFIGGTARRGVAARRTADSATFPKLLDSGPVYLLDLFTDRLSDSQLTYSCALAELVWC
jgi:hypothetical protein